jgi:hypothetical protein
VATESATGGASRNAKAACAAIFGTRPNKLTPGRARGLPEPQKRLWLRLPEGPPLDLSPSGHWPAPVLAGEIPPDDPPVMIEMEYRLAAGADGAAFVRIIEELAIERRRDGAYSWAVYQDVEDAAIYREVFLVASWSEHLRQHERVTNTDKLIQDHLAKMLASFPAIRHSIRPRFS